MNSPKNERGATLLVSMIMLVVLTLLVVFSIRSGNINLRIAGNMQSQAEAAAATQQVIEQVIEQIKGTENIALIPGQSVVVPMGATTYTVKVEPITKCAVEIPVLNSSLDPTVANDIPCFESLDEDKPIKVDGTLATKPSACKLQQWDIQAGVTDGATGTKVTQVQGLTVRVPATVDCP
jgi:hypothetical protein